ncbi:MAG: TIGR04282 family arsenosugar biosynthesis glycosyltransferase [Coriobacteriales bacterium]|jgi:rSAM/selenodomain-associated transferase 1
MSCQSSIILLTRVPVPGLVKTRLLRSRGGGLSPAQAAALQEAMALDVADRLARLGARLVVRYSDEDRVAAARGVPGADRARERFLSRLPAGAAAAPQRGAGLGERMGNAIDDELAGGVESCVLLGSDLPLADVGLVGASLGLLADSGADVVLCPSEDGGYWLVGARRPIPEVFSGKAYGAANVMEEALRSCERAGYSVVVGPRSRDVDDADDLDWLVDLVRADDPRVGLRTAALVRRELL